MARTIAWALILALFWAGLSGYSAPLLVGSGVLSIAATLWFVKANRLELQDWGVLRLLKATLVYLPWLLWQVLISNLRVIRIVLSPSLPIEPVLVEVPNQLSTATGEAIYANSITMTPGTVTLSVGETLLVHALTQEDAQGLLAGDMQERVKRLEPDA